MNATPMNLNPGNAVQATSPGGKQADAAAADVPFSQVLSNEIAQGRKGDEPAEDPAIAAGDAALQLAAAIDVAAGLVATPAADPAQEAAAPAGDAATQPPQLPDVLLGLALPVDLAKPAPAAALGAAPAQSADPDVTVGERAGRSAPALQLQVPAERAGKAVPQAAAIQAARPDDNAAPVATAGAAFPERLAAATQTETARAAEGLAELMNHPALRAAVHPAMAEAVAAPASGRLAPAVGSDAWPRALGEKLVWMAAGAQQTASLTLNPPDLGPLQVVLNVSNDQATASFFAAQPEVRQALESAFPRLREMMNEAGIQLGQATVSADTPRQHDTPERQGQRIDSAFSGPGGDVPAGQTGAPAPMVRSGRGLIDTFA